jgi:hypothetical protein
MDSSYCKPSNIVLMHTTWCGQITLQEGGSCKSDVLAVLERIHSVNAQNLIPLSYCGTFPD